MGTDLVVVTEADYLITTNTFDVGKRSSIMMSFHTPPWHRRTMYTPSGLTSLDLNKRWTSDGTWGRARGLPEREGEPAHES